MLSADQRADRAIRFLCPTAVDGQNEAGARGRGACAYLVLQSICVSMPYRLASRLVAKSPLDQNRHRFMFKRFLGLGAAMGASMNYTGPTTSIAQQASKAATYVAPREIKTSPHPFFCFLSIQLFPFSVFDRGEWLLLGNTALFVCRRSCCRHG